MSLDALAPDEILRLRIHAKYDLYAFTRYMFRIMRGYRWLRADHHKIICDALMDVFTGKRRNLLINIPPRYSKTELAVINFVAWGMGRCPNAEFIHCSSTAPLALSNSQKIIAMMSHPEYRRIFPARLASSGKNHWKTTDHGVFYATGTDGQITGFGAGNKDPMSDFGGAIICDDLHKAMEARSPVMRQHVLDFFVETLPSRRNDTTRTPIIVIGQRLHEHDISGFLQGAGFGEPFDLISLPAIQEDGTALWPAMHTIEQLKIMQMATPYMFAGQYMQDPAPAEGNIFRPGRLRIVEAVPVGTRWVRGWDLASVEDGGDWTVGGRLGITPDGNPIIGHIERFQGGPDEVIGTIRNTAKMDGSECTIKLPQDPGQAGKSQGQFFTRELAGFTVRCEPVTGDKVTRAEPFASQVNVGNVLMLKAEWNQAVVDEMRLFPNAKHDDIIDALSDAYNALYTGDTGVLDFYDQLAKKTPAQIAKPDVIERTTEGLIWGA